MLNSYPDPLNSLSTVGVVVALALGVPGGQRPTFRSGVDLVEVDAIASDRDGNSVSGLAREDFAIREDGQPMAVTTFVPVTSDLATSDAEGRFVVMLLDNLVTAAAMTTNLKAIALAFADRMGPHDVAGVAMLNGGASRTTTSRISITAAINAFRYEASLIQPPAIAKKHALDMIRDLARQLTAVRHRRKVLVCIGAASVFVPTEAIGAGHATYSGEWLDALSEASRSNLAVYVIDPSGLTGTRPEDASAFAEATGGRVFSTNEFDKAVARVWNEAGNYYLIGYEAPTSGKAKRHTIDVRVTRPGVTAHARQSR
jgi:VWFA-related protein